MAVSEGLDWKSDLETELADRVMSEYGRTKSKESLINSEAVRYSGVWDS